VNWKKINYNENIIKKAINVTIEFKAKFWDAVIAETMKENEIVKIYTENEDDFKKIPGIKVINPFK
jgi:predicted nucleic acid-binding protein